MSVSSGAKFSTIDSSDAAAHMKAEPIQYSARTYANTPWKQSFPFVLPS